MSSERWHVAKKPQKMTHSCETDDLCKANSASKSLVSSNKTQSLSDLSMTVEAL